MIWRFRGLEGWMFKGRQGMRQEDRMAAGWKVGCLDD